MGIILDAGNFGRDRSTTIEVVLTTAVFWLVPLTLKVRQDHRCPNRYILQS